MRLAERVAARGQRDGFLEFIASRNVAFMSRADRR
jgi:hypothetical protein